MATRILFLLLVCLTSSAQITNVSIGTSPNDGAGDTLRTAFSKVNTNVNWLASQLGITSNGLTSISNNKLNITNGVPVISGIAIGTNDFVQIASPFVGTTLTVGGDSHTAGGAAYSTTNYMTVSGIINAEYRWPYLVQQEKGFSTLNNYAVSGSSARFNMVNSTFQAAHLNRLGALIGVNGTGTYALLCGYNQGYIQFAGKDFSLPFLQSYRALALRVLCDYYATAAGKDSSYANYTWTTTGSATTDTLNSYDNPFPISGTDTARVVTTLTGSQTLTVTLTNWASAAVFFDQNAFAGQVGVWNGTNTIASIQARVPFPEFSYGYTNDILPGAILIRGLSGTTTLSFTNLSATNRILAIARIPAGTPGKSLIMGSPAISLSTTRSAGVLAEMGRYVRQVCAELNDWPVYFADVGNAVKPLQHQINPTVDPDHWNPSGLRAIADAFIRAKKVNPDAPVQWQSPKFAKLTTENVMTWEQAGVKRWDAALDPSGNLYFQSYDTSGNFYDNSVIIGNATAGISAVGPLTMGGEIKSGQNITVNNTGGTTSVVLLKGGTNSYRYLSIYGPSDQQRWEIGVPAGTESGTSAGSDLLFTSYNNSGTGIGYPMQITRDGNVRVQVGGLQITGSLTTNLSAASGVEIGTVGANGILQVYNRGAGTYGKIILSGSQVETLNASRLLVPGGPVIAQGYDSSPSYEGMHLQYNTGAKIGWLRSYSGSTNTDITVTGRTVTIETNAAVVGTLSVGGTMAVTGVVSVGDGGNPGMSIKAAQNGIPFIDFNTLTTNRWRVAKNNSTESGSNVGADFVIERYSDAGALLDTPLVIVRSTGRVGIGASGTPIRIRAGTAVLGAGGTVTVFDAFVTASSNIQLTGQADGGTPGWLRVSARTPGVSFTITSSSATDTSTVGWVMVEP